MTQLLIDYAEQFFGLLAWAGLFLMVWSMAQ